MGMRTRCAAPLARFRDYDLLFALQKGQLCAFCPGNETQAAGAPKITAGRRCQLDLVQWALGQMQHLDDAVLARAAQLPAQRTPCRNAVCCGQCLGRPPIPVCCCRTILTKRDLKVVTEADAEEMEFWYQLEDDYEIISFKAWNAVIFQVKT